MNSRVKAMILAGALSWGLWAMGCSQGVYAPGRASPVTPPSTASTISPSAPTKGNALAELILQGQRTQSHESNGVTVQAAPSGKLVAGSRELTFNIELDTHSVNLDVYDLTSLAILRDSQGRESKATSWQAPKGGHHRSGVLTFSSDQPLLQPDTKYIELSVRDIANVTERVLRWELRPANS